MKQFNNLCVALVYDRVNKFGGAERILLALHQIWPQAPLYTSVYDSKGAPWAKDFKIITSFIQKIPFAKKHHEIYPWLMSFAFENFNFDNYDLVISLTSAEAKGIITKPKTFHVCYCLTPTRYLWSGYQHYLKNPRYGWLNPLARLVMKTLLAKMRKWDKIASQRPDEYLAISKTVAGRIKKYYKRKAEIIYPGIDLDKLRVLKPSSVNTRSLPRQRQKDYFLVVARLVSYKRVDVVVKAFNQLKLPLKIIGQGTEMKRLKKLANSNIEFLGQNLTEEQLLSYYGHCRALVFSGEEDLGLVFLEAQACGKPVIAYKKGGAGEIIKNGKTGILFSSQTPKALIEAVKKFKLLKFKPKDCYRQVQKFDQKVFKKKFKLLVEEKWRKYQQKMQ